MTISMVSLAICEKDVHRLNASKATLVASMSTLHGGDIPLPMLWKTIVFTILSNCQLVSVPGGGNEIGIHLNVKLTNSTGETSSASLLVPLDTSN